MNELHLQDKFLIPYFTDAKSGLDCGKRENGTEAGYGVPGGTHTHSIVDTV